MWQSVKLLGLGVGPNTEVLKSLSLGVGLHA